jgi:hypothetical protein
MCAVFVYESSFMPNDFFPWNSVVT